MPYSIRKMKPDDLPAIEELHRQQNKHHGTNYPLTNPFDVLGMQRKQVPLALTILDGDEIRQGVTFEATAVEMMCAGMDPRATATLHKEIQAAFYLLRAMGFEVVNSGVPKDVLLPIEKPLKDVGFKRVDGRIAWFQKDLTEGI